MDYLCVAVSFHRNHKLFTSLTLETEHLFNLKFAAKELQRNSKRCDKEEKAEKAKVKKVGLHKDHVCYRMSEDTRRNKGPLMAGCWAVMGLFNLIVLSYFSIIPQAIQKGNMEVARIHAENAIRQKNQSINFLRMSARVDAVAARVQTAVTVNQVSLW